MLLLFLLALVSKVLDMLPFKVKVLLSGLFWIATGNPTPFTLMPCLCLLLVLDCSLPNCSSVNWIVLTLQVPLFNPLLPSPCLFRATSPLLFLTTTPTTFLFPRLFRPLTLEKSDFHYNLCVTDKCNQNLSQVQKELLCWHFRLGHRDFSAIQHLLCGGHLGNSPICLLAGKCTPPKCASCQFGKQKRITSSPSLHHKPLQDEGPSLKDNITHPGQRVFVDHFVCSTPGRLFSGFGKSKQQDQFAGGCLFVDAASRYIFTEMHVGLNSHETLAAKTKFERVLSDMGVVVTEYVSDNSSVFTSPAFAHNLLTFRQTSHFAGVGAHHQNGVAKRAIQTIMSMARTSMLHATIRWGEVHTSTLWPMAVSYAIWLYNHTPDPKSGLAPIDLMSCTTWPRRKLKDTHVWGCPAYALEPKIADGKKVPCWNTRSHQGMFVGFSPEHASNIPLVLNLGTGKISPLFHIVFDDWFTTVVAPQRAILNRQGHKVDL